MLLTFYCHLQHKYLVLHMQAGDSRPTVFYGLHLYNPSTGLSSENTVTPRSSVPSRS